MACARATTARDLMSTPAITAHPERGVADAARVVERGGTPWARPSHTVIVAVRDGLATPKGRLEPRGPVLVKWWP